MNMTLEKKKYQSPMPTTWSPRDEMPRKTQQQMQTNAPGKVDVYNYYSRGMRNDTSLHAPIRQTASIFKQPVTIYKMLEGKVKEIKPGNQEKPRQDGADKQDKKYNSKEKAKQLFWEKRLEGLRPCDQEGYEPDRIILPKGLKPVGPNITVESSLQSIAAALQLNMHPVTGQSGPKNALEKNPGVFLNPEQPLLQAVSINEDDVKRQEEQVAWARKKLQETMQMYKH